MSDLSRRFEQVIRSAIKKHPFIPQRVDEGIQLGKVLISSNENLKNIYKNGELIYKEVSLNTVTIRLAETLAVGPRTRDTDRLYDLDQQYSKWFIDSQIMRAHYEKAIHKKDHIKSDIYWTRYQESKNLALTYKKQAEQLAANRINT